MNLAGVVIDESDKPVSDAQVYVSLAITETALPGGARTFRRAAFPPEERGLQASGSGTVDEGFPLQRSGNR